MSKSREVFAFRRSTEERVKDCEDGVAILGGLQTPSYRDSYEEAARMLLNTARATNDLDKVALPLFFLMRHSFELALKDMASALQERDDNKGQIAAGSEQEWEHVVAAQMAAKERVWETSHVLKTLVVEVDKALEKQKWPALEPCFHELAEMFDRFERGMVERARFERGRRKYQQNKPGERSLPGGFLEDDELLTLPLLALHEKLKALLDDHFFWPGSDDDAPSCTYSKILEELHSELQTIGLRFHSSALDIGDVAELVAGDGEGPTRRQC